MSFKNSDETNETVGNQLPHSLDDNGKAHAASPSNPIPTSQFSVLADTGGNSQAVSISTTSAQSSTITASSVVIYASVPCFLRQGGNPTALSDGTDQYVPDGMLLRVQITLGNKLAFKTASGTGTVYITPSI